ncbi:MAG: hypothetical protein AB7T06_40085 [Kofleriaceae bacterium]
MTATHAGTVSRIPGTIIEIDTYDELDITYDDDGQQIPDGIEWLVWLPTDAQRRAEPEGMQDENDGPLLTWYSLHTREFYDADDIDVSEARLISVPIAETAARLLIGVDQLNGPQSASEAIWMNVGDSRIAAIRHLLDDTDPIAGEIERPARIAALAALGVTEHEIEQATAS